MRLKLLLFTAWFVAITGALAFAMMKHEVAFAPAAGARSVAGLASLGAPVGASWTLTHILAVDCGCSKALVRHLVERRALAGVREQVLLVGTAEDMRKTLTGAGYEVRSVPAKGLAREAGIAGVPWLLITDPSLAMRYSGGYSNRLITPDTRVDEVSWLRTLQAGDTVRERPVFGCAISHGWSRVLGGVGG